MATSDGNLRPFNTAGLTNANVFGVADDQLFLGGDIRTNEQVGLASMHTLRVREHRVEGTTLAEVIRDNTGIRNEIPDNVFFLDN